jgi:hypothetical protein
MHAEPKIHRSYSVEEVSRLFGIHKNTVGNWLRQGLSPIDGERPDRHSRCRISAS